MKFVFDLDGTLCFNGVSIDQDIILALKKLEEYNHEVIFASARPIRDLLPLIPQFRNNKLIGGNGSIVADKGEISVVKLIDENSFEQIQKIIDKHQLSYIIDDKFDYAASVDPSNKIFKQLDPDKLAQKIQIAEIKQPIKIILLDAPSIVENELAELSSDISVISHANEGNFDITSGGINKFTTLNKVFEIDDYIAFGNDHNDIELLKNAKSAYLIGDPENAKKLFLENQVNIVPKDSKEVAKTIMSLGKEYE
ncbi:hypothetical protein BG262_08340 [Floricoccus penangensis]|uniref:Hydrolase n=1 Tax=Floricoccus penangensis TaxID=1859475 RepID=A0A9Q5P0J4_9LACT|nr:HAD-IIB family hydrolase [Floricoccus penangensis]OFI47831.1 hypothetical protein BG262_08340 [Floricoccus penangensis]